ncbi:MAG: hypothetical protein M5U07_07640 [Xanthobacteraceae bacterium]|nr:hypothetical protein [Xanthobacteraceae bacterium]
MHTDSSREAGFRGRAFTTLVIMAMRGATQVAKFGLTLFVARFLDLETLGLYGLIAGLTVILPVVAGLGLFNCLSRNAVTQTLPETIGEARRYLEIQAVVHALVLAAAALAGTLWSGALLATLVVVTVLLEHLNNDISTLLNHLRRPRLSNVLMFVRSAAWIAVYVALALLLPSLRTLPALLAFWIGGSLVAVVAFTVATRDWPWASALAAGRPRGWFRDRFLESRALYVNHLANIVGQFLDRYLVGLFMGLELTGVYFLFWSIGNALMNLVRTGMIQVSEPHLIRAYGRRDGSYAGLFRRFVLEVVLTTALFGLVTAGLAHYGLSYLQRPLLADWLPVLWLILLGAVLRMIYEVQEVNLYSRREDIRILASSIAVFAVSLIANLLLVPRYALYGPAMAMMLACIVGIAYRHVLIAGGSR